MFDTLLGILDLLGVKLHDKDNSKSVRFFSVINSSLLTFPVESDPSCFHKPFERRGAKLNDFH